MKLLEFIVELSWKARHFKNFWRILSLSGARSKVRNSSTFGKNGVTECRAGNCTKLQRVIPIYEFLKIDPSSGGS